MIKDLEWVDHGNYLQAQVAMDGVYRIELVDGNQKPITKFRWSLSNQFAFLGMSRKRVTNADGFECWRELSFKTIDQTKAAAFADWEKRIKPYIDEVIL